MPIVGPFTNAFVSVAGVDLSNKAFSISVTDSRQPKDVTTFGSSYVQETKGLGEASIEIEFMSDNTAGSVNPTLQPLIGSSTPFQVEVRANNAARSATNPGIVLAAALLFTFKPLDGSIGEPATFKAEFRNAPGGTGITYPTA